METRPGRHDPHEPPRVGGPTGEYRGWHDHPRRPPRDGWTRNPGTRPPPPARRGYDAGDPAERLEPGWASALAWTVGCYLVPVLVYLAWVMTLATTPPAGCVEVTGAPCPSPRAQTLTDLVGVLPAIGGALALALLAAVGLRAMTSAWRGGTVGLAAAVIGAGGATIIATVVG